MYTQTAAPNVRSPTVRYSNRLACVLNFFFFWLSRRAGQSFELSSDGSSHSKKKKKKPRHSDVIVACWSRVPFAFAAEYKTSLNTETETKDSANERHYKSVSYSRCTARFVFVHLSSVGKSAVVVCIVVHPRDFPRKLNVSNLFRESCKTRTTLSAIS